MNLAAMEDFAGQAPQSLWPRIWRTAKPSVINHFLRNPELDAPSLSALIRPPLTHDQVVALHKSEFLMDKGIVFQVLRTMARSFQDPDTDLVLGLAAPWIMALRPSERLEVAEALVYPPMERLAQVWGSRFNPPA
jgi:hypothetical protein